MPLATLVGSSPWMTYVDRAHVDTNFQRDVATMPGTAVPALSASSTRDARLLAIERGGAHQLPRRPLVEPVCQSCSSIAES